MMYGGIRVTICNSARSGFVKSNPGAAGLQNRKEEFF